MNQPTKSSSVRSAAPQWSRNASASASQIRRWSASTTGRISSPSGSGASGIGSDRARTIMKPYRTRSVALRLEQGDRADLRRRRPTCPARAARRVGHVAGRPRAARCSRPAERAPGPGRAAGTSGWTQPSIWWTDDPVADRDVRLGRADDPAVDLGDDDVAGEVEVRPVLEVVADVLGRSAGSRRRRRSCGSLISRDEAVDVGVEVERAGTGGPRWAARPAARPRPPRSWSSSSFLRVVDQRLAVGRGARGPARTRSSDRGRGHGWRCRCRRRGQALVMPRSRRTRGCGR